MDEEILYQGCHRVLTMVKLVLIRKFMQISSKSKWIERDHWTLMTDALLKMLILSDNSTEQQFLSIYFYTNYVKNYHV